MKNCCSIIMNFPPLPLITPYPYPNDATVLGFGHSFALQYLYNNDRFASHLPAHMGIPPVHIHKKTGIPQSMYPLHPPSGRINIKRWPARKKSYTSNYTPAGVLTTIMLRTIRRKSAREKAAVSLPREQECRKQWLWSHKAKKCRARYGLDTPNQWCKPCRLGNQRLVTVSFWLVRFPHLQQPHSNHHHHNNEWTSNNF